MDNNKIEYRGVTIEQDIVCGKIYYVIPHGIYGTVSSTNLEEIKFAIDQMKGEEIYGNRRDRRNLPED